MAVCTLYFLAAKEFNEWETYNELIPLTAWNASSLQRAQLLVISSLTCIYQPETRNPQPGIHLLPVTHRDYIIRLYKVRISPDFFYQECEFVKYVYCIKVSFSSQFTPFFSFMCYFFVFLFEMHILGRAPISKNVAFYVSQKHNIVSSCM